ncbi:Hydroxylysine kinase [Holothuria leucospilota]|uniref:Hydroxylysine kinase n=1 Tax=Holothuria leucospilota TaxID=206669 RepID=A0A9Q0YP58_HOLLE|nr:Hydroxylysine kinase [Holothuria leucospilota]
MDSLIWDPYAGPHSVLEDTWECYLSYSLLSLLIASVCLLLVGFIHGDFSDVNIIVDFQEERNECHFSGFIDFDNAMHTCTVYDIGIALMYLLQSKATSSNSSNSAAKHFLQGYSKYRKMAKLEKDCLIYCIAGRFFQSLLGGLFHYSIYKDEYCLLTQQRGWDALKEMWTREKKASFQNWNFS